jgi:hypothetical protein
MNPEIKAAFAKWAKHSKKWINHDATTMDIFAAGFAAGQRDILAMQSERWTELVERMRYPDIDLINEPKKQTQESPTGIPVGAAN